MKRLGRQPGPARRSVERIEENSGGGCVDEEKEKEARKRHSNKDNRK